MAPGGPEVSCSHVASITERTGKRNHAKTSATTRAGFTLVSFCSNPWKE